MAETMDLGRRNSDTFVTIEPCSIATAVSHGMIGVVSVATLAYGGLAL